MIEIPFMKLHGAENDFLLTPGDQARAADLAEVARRICARTTGIGADGYMLLWKQEGGLATRLFNSDGSEPEISGNGTRCAAAYALAKGLASPPNISISTAAGNRTLRFISRRGNQFVFEMDMGLPKTTEIRTPILLSGANFDATILDVGNPQCAIFVDEFPASWQTLAQEAERHIRFPRGSNISFVRVIDRHTIQAVFFERGVGETKSSGTGSTGAALAAILRGVAESPVDIRTPAGMLRLRWNDSVYLTGPAEIIGEGNFFLDL